MTLPNPISTSRASLVHDDGNGFTIIEVLIALTLSLLLMLSLTQAFKYLSERIRENRTAVELSTRLNNVVNLMEEDLRNVTVPLRPQTYDSQYDGYFVYYEGPGTDATSVLFGTQPTATASEYYQDSRFGDFDDYVAFTAYSPNKPFRGFVPKYVLLANSDAAYLTRLQSGSLTAAELQDAIQPATITSNYAEIVYWVSPSLTIGSGQDGLGGTNTTISYDSLGSPEIRYEAGSNYPARMTLHRRVLLIRPDLNATTGTFTGALPQLNFPVGSDFYTFMQPDPWPTEPGTGNLPRIIRTGSPPHGDQRTRAWQIGMTPVHQQCDLSVRWVLGSNGLPTTSAAANTLADLTIPHNRFAHVRAPHFVVGFPSPLLNGFTTMPILAVGSQLRYIEAGFQQVTNNDQATFETFARDVNLTTATPAGIRSSFNGFLRPEFALGMDYTHTEVPGTFWGRERFGDDILSTEMLAFDLQAFDAVAPVAFTDGPDGQPGTAGLDDDGNGMNDNLAERGAPNSDDTVVTVSDPLFFQIARGTPVLASRGEFVDLTYDRLAGGPIRAFGPIDTRPLKGNNSSSTVTNAPSNANLDTLCVSNLSGFRNASNANTIVLNQASLPFRFIKSGKAIVGGDRIVRLFQPTYDTFTTHYESDGWQQRDVNRDGVQVSPTTSFRFGTVWWLPHSSITAADIDRAADGVDTISNFSLGRYGDIDGEFERETSPPFEAPLSAVRVRLRVQDQGSGTIQQQSVVADSL